MDPLPPQPPFFTLPSSTFSSVAVQNAAPSFSSAQIIPEVPPQNHVANAVPPSALPPTNHPSYTDMIYAAITALKERDGSSKRAIAKYIERVYTGLPATHSALLTHHLKRLKNTGLLVMVKKSYMLPRSDSAEDNNINSTTAAAASPPAATNPHPDAPSAPLTAVSASSPSGPRRGRGRPPKPKPDSSQTELISSSSQPAAVVSTLNSQSVMVPVGLSISTQPGTAPPAATHFTDPAISAPTPPSNNLPNAAPASHVQMIGKRRPGRPKKAPGQTGAVLVSSGKKRGRPPKSGSLGVKKSPGRPRKPKSVAANGVKKNPKRLLKSVVVPYATGSSVLNVTRPRGRPRKGEDLAAPAAGALDAKRPGLPLKDAGVFPPKTGGRPVGRPKKNANSWSQSQSQADAYEDLKRKFEIFQARVKQAVSLLRPTLSSETAITAIAAIQDLEEISTLDLNSPFTEEAPLSQLPQPQAQPPPPPPQEAVTQN